MTIATKPESNSDDLGKFAGRKFVGAGIAITVGIFAAMLVNAFAKVDHATYFENEPCLQDNRLMINVRDLRRIAHLDIDHTEPGLHAVDRIVRTCMLQIVLHTLGCGPGPIDGYFGPRSKAAFDRCTAEYAKWADSADDIRRCLVHAYSEKVTPRFRLKPP